MKRAAQTAALADEIEAAMIEPYPPSGERAERARVRLNMGYPETSVWRCQVCGYEHVGATPPDICPVCGVGPEMFDVVAARS